MVRCMITGRYYSKTITTKEVLLIINTMDMAF